MSSQDLTRLLAEWTHEPGRINARKIAGDDGREKLQVRIELGVLQMELDGRPDGDRPHGFASLLEHHLDRLRRYVEESGGASGFVLSPEDCAELRLEAVQYYHRYLGLLVLEDYEGVITDTRRSLALFDLCRDFAAEPDDAKTLERFRGYVIMMRARAEASKRLDEGQAKAAQAVLETSLEEIRQWLVEEDREADFDDLKEAQLLRGMRDMLVPRLPVSQRSELEGRLRAALDAENYELAAILRDELRMSN